MSSKSPRKKRKFRVTFHDVQTPTSDPVSVIFWAESMNEATKFAAQATRPPQSLGRYTVESVKE